MGAVVAIGEAAELDGLSLAGVTVIVAPDDRAAKQAWRSVAPDVDLVVLGHGAAKAVEDEDLPTERLVVVLP